MALELSMTNIFQLFSAMAPMMLGCFLLLLSVFNQDVKAFIYLGGVLIASVINLIIMSLIKSPISTQASPVCNLINIPFLNTSMYNSPSFNSTFIGFTASYLIAPMFDPIKGHDPQPNYAVIATMMSLFIIDGFTKVLNQCTNPAGVMFGGLIGFLLGYMWFMLLRETGGGQLTYFSNFVSNFYHLVKN